MRSFLLTGKALIAALSISLTTVSAAFSAETAVADRLTKQAAELSEKGKFEEAVELEKQAVASVPGYWVPHSALAYLNWRQTDTQKAFAEGAESVKLAPRNTFALINYARLHQLTGALDEAVLLYGRAAKLTPNDWVPLIGQAQCMVMLARKPEAQKILDGMLAKKSASYDWWYQLSDIYLKIGDFKKAEIAAGKAMSLASTDSQKSECVTQNYVAALKADDLDKARELRPRAFAGKPDDEVYLLTLAKLIPTSTPDDAKGLLDSAIKSGNQTTDFYYSFGKQCDEKISAEAKDKTQAWIDTELQAYRAALTYAANQGKLHLALADLLDREGKSAAMMEELQKAEANDDTYIAPYLVSVVKAAGDQQHGSINYKLALSNLSIAVDNMTCACKLPSLVARLRSMQGVAFAGVVRAQQPFELAAMIDPKVLTANELVHRLSLKSTLSFRLVSSSPVSTISEAIRSAKKVTEGNRVLHVYSFKQSSPTMPVI